MTAQKKAAERKEYTVKVDSHTHKGEAVPKGGTVDLTEKQAASLKEKGVI